ncbi:hypothetical protein [Thermoflavimicrobium daqui]|jgi:hypothetical protein|uniref:Uncharacterized protein n=1 Tax=Thermoflavimicrobium daqui TaxID=2137476 RepID=A0A364K589_9BACL|nr:hypothetical protein [Thermoflavimicrobium daqui]RAL24429.1 hypothetical protein DL897_08880 [Thermoflavimicrobium daqui]
MKKLGLHILIIAILLFSSACSSNPQSSPDAVLTDIIKKATSGNLTEIYKLESMVVYTSPYRQGWLQKNIKKISGNLTKSKFIREEVKLLIAENPYRPQTDTYKHYIVKLPLEEGSKLVAKGVPSNDIQELTNGVLVGLVSLDNKWFLDLSYKDMGSVSFQKSSPPNAENEINWEEIKEEMVLPAY